jgi:ABC-type multidrug transport system ATPase subunit
MCNSIEVKSAFKNYVKDGRENFILKGLHMHVKVGQIYSLIGASGCGKTTLLQCILGMKELNHGSISVLGRSVQKISHKIGYMPQQNELTPELTIKETLEYFGNVFQMKQEIFKSRYRMIHELLDLPDDSRKVENLSGGQARRVSLAVAIIHNPLILILDEPTVGLDAILRDKIWNFLKLTAHTTKASIVITTHYISEAMSSDCVGLMRDGRLLAEDTPNNIISNYGVETLDEAFLKLCISSTKNNQYQLVPSIETFVDESEIIESRSDDFEPIEKRRTFDRRTMATLLKKEIIRIKRQPWEIVFMIIFPIIQVVGFGFCIGGNLKYFNFNYFVNDKIFFL